MTDQEEVEREPDLRRPSLIQLRLRALVGVSARAEILKLMLADPERNQKGRGLRSDEGAHGRHVEMVIVVVRDQDRVDLRQGLQRHRRRVQPSGGPALLVEARRW